MNLANLTGTPIFRRLSYLRSVSALVRRMPEFKKEKKKRSGQWRDVMLEMMMSHPETFQSELAFQNMMYVYPSRF